MRKSLSLAVAARRRAAAESYRAAYNIDPGLGKGLSAEEYASGKLKAAAGQKKN
ncbi:MAG: hypothetical protein LC795_10075 [Acidobacteria bacterium]|nr:hypothetical protein [Acidobacteriota bacterium]